MLAGCLAGFSALALRVLAPLRKNILLKVFEDRRVLPRLKGVALAKIDEPSRLRFVRACKQIFAIQNRKERFTSFRVGADQLLARSFVDNECSVSWLLPFEATLRFIIR